MIESHRYMGMTAPDVVSSVERELEHAELRPAASLFHGFSDPSRLSILRHLALGEHGVVDLP